MCFDYDGTVEFWHEETRKARKPHRCDACRETIAKGDQYTYQSGKYDGEFFDDHMCRRCCYDTARVVIHELEEGCYWSEAWPTVDHLLDYLEESGMGQTPHASIPADFDLADWPTKAVEKMKAQSTVLRAANHVIQSAN